MTGCGSADLRASSIATTFCQFPCLAGMDLGLEFQDFSMQKKDNQHDQLWSTHQKTTTHIITSSSSHYIILSLSEDAIKKTLHHQYHTSTGKWPQAPLLHALDSLHSCRKSSGSTWNRPTVNGIHQNRSTKSPTKNSTKGLSYGIDPFLLGSLFLEQSCHRNAMDFLWIKNHFSANIYGFLAYWGDDST